MAAKQGLSAQISQASEDAKRAVLTRTNLSSSLWFSNLNTTCTIKSAPPRSPEVLGLLAAKSGWLLKRNEQHIWQSRWCCVVPHTFLYYFDAHPSAAASSPPLTAKQQEMLNKAVRQGYGKRGAAKQHQPRSSLYHVLGTGQTSQTPPDVEPDPQVNHTLQPAGIIDLECYTTVHRNSQNACLMELAGDDTVNPDLRSFYFCAASEEEGEDWTQALLNQRHSSLLDEKEAYRQVCDGFAQQLQMLHMELEDSQRKSEKQQDELYRVRSQMEDSRRNCWRLVQETLERNEGGVPAKKAYRTDLETIQSQDLGLLAAVQLLCDYTRVLEETCGDCVQKITKLESDLEKKQEGNHSRVRELETELEQLRKEMEQQKAGWQTQLETLQQKYIQSQKECQDVQKDLASQRMEMTMYQSSTRTKISELQSHKKILKKEVIELRQKMEEVNSELDLQKHKESSTKLEAEQERQKAKLLERYVEKMETQVKVQQNMMEMMSSAGSQYGGSVHGDYQYDVPSSPAVRSVTKSFSNRDFGQGPINPREYGGIIVNTPSSVQQEDGQGSYHEHDLPTPSSTVGKRNGRRQIDDDNKSHMSELTEDRTQKQFDAAYLYQHPNRALAASPRSIQQQPSMGGPPSIIGVSEEKPSDGGGGPSIASAATVPAATTPTQDAPPRLDTIMSTHSMLQKRTASLLARDGKRFDAAASKPVTPQRGTIASGDAGSVSSIGSIPKLSVAQRARQEAERGNSTPVRVRVNPQGTPQRGNTSSASPAARGVVVNTTPSNNSQGSGFFSNLGKRLEEALDGSVLGVDVGSQSSGGSFSRSEYAASTMSDQHQEEKKTSESASVSGSSVQTGGLSLMERQKLQREQQLKFLKDQGLLKEQDDIVAGGAGSASPANQDKNDGNSSVTSISFPTSGLSFSSLRGKQSPRN